MSHCNYSEWAPVPLSIKSKCVKALMDFCIRLYNWQKGKIWKRTEEKIFLCSREVLWLSVCGTAGIKACILLLLQVPAIVYRVWGGPIIRKITPLHCENRFTCTDYFPFPVLSFLRRLLLIVTEKGESLVLRSLCGGQNGQQKPVNMLCNLYWPLQSYSVCAYQYKGLLPCPTTHIWHRNALRPTP